MAKPRSDRDRRSILAELRARFTRSAAWEATARSRYVADTKFAEGDSDNNWQWPDDIRQPRSGDKRPMLTINKTRQHNIDVLNDARQSKVAIKIIPTGNGATYESAQAYMGVARHTEYISNADTAYQHALACAVKGGWGYFRLTTEYISPTSFDQDIFIKRIANPLLVYDDPDVEQTDASDRRYLILAVDMPRDEFDRKYPKWKGRIASAELGDHSWVSQDKVRIAEYWRRREKNDRLVGYRNPLTGELAVSLESELPRRIKKAILDAEDTQFRDVTTYVVEFFKVIGDEIAEEEPWPGMIIPFCRVIGEETVIEGQMDRKGHTRGLKDGQRMLNYNASAFVEYGALQTKVPWLAAAEAIEGFEGFWKDANVRNFNYLPWNALDEEGNALPMPTRPGPPQGTELYIRGMMDGVEFMRMASGQFQADMGEPSNERSGKAIIERRRAGDNATYHYLDHQSQAIRLCGKIIIDLAPKIYDTRRLLRYRSEDGTEQSLTIDPGLKQAFLERKGPDGQEVIEAILNPMVGSYDVEADVGPSFATKRQEAWETYVQILAQNKDLTAIIGDLAMQFADFPGADEAAQRLKRMVPKQALGDGDTPDVTALKQQLEQASKLITDLAERLKDKSSEREAIHDKNAISGYDSVTKRVMAVKEALGLDPVGLRVLVKEVLEEAILTSSHAEGPGGMAHEGLEAPVPEAMGGPRQPEPVPLVDPSAPPPAAAE